MWSEASEVEGKGDHVTRPNTVSPTMYVTYPSCQLGEESGVWGNGEEND